MVSDGILLPDCTKICSDSLDITTLPEPWLFSINHQRGQYQGRHKILCLPFFMNEDWQLEFTVKNLIKKSRYMYVTVTYFK